MFAPESCTCGVCLSTPGSERGIDDSELMPLRYEVHFRDSQHAAQLFRGHSHGPGGRRCARHRLGKSGGHGGMKSGVALYFLHDLMNMPVQHGDGAEPFKKGECLLAV